MIEFPMSRREALSLVCHGSAVLLVAAAGLWLVIGKDKGMAIFGLLAAAVTARLLAVDLVRWLAQDKADDR
jgi:hypothetical protein